MLKFKSVGKVPFGAFRGPAGRSSLTKRDFPILTFYEKCQVFCTSKILRNDAGNDFSITLYTLQKLRRNLLQSIKKIGEKWSECDDSLKILFLGYWLEINLNKVQSTFLPLWQKFSYRFNTWFICSLTILVFFGLKFIAFQSLEILWFFWFTSKIVMT